MSEDPRIILIGGSAGGLEGLTEIILSLNPDRNISVFTAIHSAGDKLVDILEKRLDNSNEWNIQFAKNNDTIKSGYIYVAPSNHHMLLRKQKVHVNKGPRVNRSRPSIDLLFRSAAVAYHVQTIGALLSGSLYDGVAGVQAIRQCGGITIAQDPDDASYPDLPTNAIETGDVDHIKPASEIGSLINDFVDSPVNPQKEIPKELILENKLDLSEKFNIEMIDQLGEKVSFSCPECGGPLWEISEENPLRYRCHSGHCFNSNSLLEGQDSEIEDTLRMALRTMEEKLRIQEKMAKSGTVNGGLQERLSETKTHTNRLRKLLQQL